MKVLVCADGLMEKYAQLFEKNSIREIVEMKHCRDVLDYLFDKDANLLIIDVTKDNNAGYGVLQAFDGSGVFNRPYKILAILPSLSMMGKVNADYCLEKRFDINVLIKIADTVLYDNELFMRELAKKKHKIEVAVCRTGVLPYRPGYYFVNEMMLMFLDHILTILFYDKLLVPMIAYEYNISPFYVRYRIQQCIKASKRELDPKTNEKINKDVELLEKYLKEHKTLPDLKKLFNLN